jgi:hypothetical protein
MENKNKADISKYVVNVQGKEYITFPGLLAEAHAQGLLAIETSLVNENLENPIIKAQIHMKGDPLSSGQHSVKLFTGYGDANANNVAKKVAGALIRMAETRAIARALRFACNIDMTALEEIGISDDEVEQPPAKTFIKKFNTPNTVVTIPNDPPVDKGDSSGTVILNKDEKGNFSATLSAVADSTVPTQTTPAAAPKRTFNKRATTTKEPTFP